MKIMHVTDWASGGVATYLETVCNAQSKQYKIYLLASEKNSEKRIIQRKNFISIGSYSRTLKGILSALKITRKKLQEIQPDILFIHSSFAGVFARLATVGLKNKPKIIYCAHGWSFLMEGSPIKQKIYQWIELGLSSITDVIITISDSEQQAAIKASINEKKLIKIDHGITEDREQLDPNFANADTFKYGDDTFNILFIGRYDYQKGFDWLINFIHKHPMKNICWHSAGKSIVTEKISIPKNIVDHGWIPYEQIPQLLLRCDAIIMPSRWEGFGLTAIEAMKYAKPVIASKKGALPELIKEGENGWLFDMETDNELMEILQSLQKKDLETMGRNGYMLFIKNYTESKMIDSINSLISTLVSTKHN